MTTLKLSEAIRLGAMLKPKALCIYAPRVATCALGAAADAAGLLIETDDPKDSRRTLQALMLRFDLLHRSMPCPVCGVSRPLRSQIPHLNDYYHGSHDWTREQIADWVESIEQQHALTTEAPIAEGVTA